MGGSNSSTNLEGDYGTLSVFTASNYPGSRQFMVGWYDAASQMQWIFGGQGSSPPGMVHARRMRPVG
jgi:hypothetical protein